MDKFYQFIIEQREKHMEERDKRDVPEVGVCSFLGRQAVGGKPAHTESKEDRGTGSESTPRLQLPCQTFSCSASTTRLPCLRSSGRIGPTSRRRCRIGGTSSSPSSTRGMRNCSRGRPPGRITSTCWWPRAARWWGG